MTRFERRNDVGRLCRLRLKWIEGILIEYGRSRHVLSDSRTSGRCRTPFDLW